MWKLQREFLDIDGLLKHMEEITQDAGLGGIGYQSQVSEINEISQDMLHLNAYIRSAIPELEDRLDNPLCKHFNQNATESISLDDYTQRASRNSGSLSGAGGRKSVKVYK